jgi:outer membrane lipoprotein-sorting protein
MNRKPAPGAAWLGILLLPLLLRGQSAEEVARAAENKLRSLQTLQADFKQIYYSSTVSTPLEEKGRLSLLKPGWMKWEYREPEKKIYLIKDDLVQEYIPGEKLLTEQKLASDDEGASALGILSGGKNILEHYQVDFTTFPTEAKNVHQLKLTPLSGEDDTALLLEIDARSRLIQKLISFDWAGNRQEYHFNRIRTDVRLNRRDFELDLPPDVEIIRPPAA